MKTWTTPAGMKSPLFSELLSQPHVMIAGATGSGKSVVLNGLIYDALYKSPNDVSFILCDPKRVELSRYKNLPHTIRFANSLETIRDALELAAEIMEARFQAMEKAGELETTERDIYVIVDEFAKLMTKGATMEESRLKRRCESLIEQIGEEGRAARVHLVLATQAPNRQTIKANISLNITGKLALRCDTEIESKQIIGRKGAEKLPMYGEALYKSPKYRDPVPVYNIPYLPQEEINARIKFWTDQTSKPGFFKRLFCA